jgi:ABC-type nitrate/sulfonate/bicarbonate transport system substrate-binding protein
VLTLANHNADTGPQSAAVPFALRRNTVGIGFLRLLDSAPLLVAREAGLFGKHGVKVELTREAGWATIREKLVHGEMAAAQALGPMAFSLQLGIGCPQRDVCVGMILNLHGNGITLSEDLRRRGVQGAVSLAREVQGTRSLRGYTFGVVAIESSHNLILRDWLRSGGLDPDKDVRIVILPPEQMLRALESGHLDGYCVGEPYNAKAWRTRLGFPVVSSAELHPGHPEKVLLARADFVREREPEFLKIIAALLEACEYCDDPENRDELVALLAREENLDCDADTLRACLAASSLKTGAQFSEGSACPVRFFTDNANSPTLKRGMWIVNLMEAENLLGSYIGSNRTLVEDVFRWDLFSKARRSAEIF